MRDYSHGNKVYQTTEIKFIKHTHLFLHSVCNIWENGESIHLFAKESTCSALRFRWPSS